MSRVAPHCEQPAAKAVTRTPQFGHRVRSLLNMVDPERYAGALNRCSTRTKF
jgi:hypothetical protein